MPSTKMYEVKFTFSNSSKHTPLVWLIEADNEAEAMRAIYNAWQPPAAVGSIEIHENTKYFQVTMKSDYVKSPKPCNPIDALQETRIAEGFGE